jgi:hypothetical protein
MPTEVARRGVMAGRRGIAAGIRRLKATGHLRRIFPVGGDGNGRHERGRAVSGNRLAGAIA